MSESDNERNPRHRDYYLLTLTGLSYREIADSSSVPIEEVRRAVEDEVSRHVDLDDFDSFEDALDYLRLGRLQRGLWLTATKGGVGESRQLLSVIEQRAELKRSSRPISEDDLIDAMTEDVALVLLQFRKGAKPGLLWEDMVLYDRNGLPTDEYRKIYHI